MLKRETFTAVAVTRGSNIDDEEGGGALLIEASLVEALALG